MKKSSLHMAIVAALAGYTAVGTPVAWSQAGGALEEIVVTATRREQNLQDVPLAVVAYTGENLETQGISHMEDLNAVVPNVVIAGDNVGTDSASFVMRGIPNVGTYIDGVWQVSNSGLLLREFVELDRVEVLRGPQGTLYGRDSTGGAIRLYTKPPAQEFGVVADFAIGNLDRRDVKLSVDVPFSETFRSRFTLGNYDRDGYITSKTTGIKTGAFQDEIARADFIWEPSDRVSLRFNAQDDTLVSNTARVQTWIENQLAWNTGIQVGLAEAYDIASGIAFGQRRWNCNYACAGWPGGQLDEWETTSEITVPSRQWLEQQTVDLQVDITDNIGFQYLLGHTDVDARTYNDWDSGEFNFYIDYFNNKTELTSHEFQFSGGTDRISWVGGAYFWDQEGRARNPAWSMREWSDFGNNYGQAQPFNYTTMVRPSAACQRTPASVGVNFTGQVNLGLSTFDSQGRMVTPYFITAADANTTAGWPFPCNWAGGGGWVAALAAGAGPVAGDRLSGNEIDGYAAFGEVVIGITERFDLTLGYRFHDQENVQYTFDVQAGIAAGITAPKPVETNKEWYAGGVYDGIINPSSRLSNEFDKGTPRIVASYQLSDDVMFYASYTEGFNSGGLAVYFDSLGQVQATYQPEVIENTELGFRSDLLDGRLRLNATVFSTDWIGVQLPATIRDRATNQEITELVTQNAASAKAEGLELEISYAISDTVLFQSNLGWLDTAYTDTQSPAVTLNTEFSRAPENTYNLGIQWDKPLAAGGNLTTRFDASYTGEYWRSSTPSLRQNAYGVPRNPETGDVWMFNGRLAFQPADGNYELSLYGTNLTNEYLLNSGFLHNIWQFDFATVDRPREVGVQMRVFFD
jgi:iron complex outermembrane receptor protein